MAKEKNQPLDIFHPLTTLDWEEHAGPPERADTQCVLLHGKLHIGRTQVVSLSLVRCGLYISSQDLSSWTHVKTPAGHFGLTTYHSQLVLVGGMTAPIDYHTRSLSSDLWVSSDGSHWAKLLPPMNKARYRPLVVNPGSPECLFVTGGSGDLVIEVYLDGQGTWSQVASIPFNSLELSSTLKNGVWYIGGSRRNPADGYDLAYCEVEALVSAARNGGEGREILTLRKYPISFHPKALLAVFENELLILEKLSGMIFALYPHTQTWVCVGNAPETLAAQILVMGKSYSVLPGRQVQPAEANIARMKVLPYHCDHPFILSALCKLEGKGFPILSALERVHDKLAATVGVIVDEAEYAAPQAGVSVDLKHLLSVLTRWIAEQHPTWRALFGVLNKLNLEDLSYEIEEYLGTSSGIKSLKEMCVSVIISALQQRRSLDPDQLQDRLPDYVSPRDKQIICNKLEAFIHPLNSSAGLLPKLYF